MNFNPLKRYNLYFRKKNPYETSPKAQQFFNALYHFHNPYHFKISCLKKKKKKKKKTHTHTYETNPKTQQYFNALYHFHKPYLFKVACRKI